jgi:hypothetical protein
MSKWWGVHNDEDEVAYSSEQPKLRYEAKQARCRLSRETSFINPRKSSTHTKSLSIVKRKDTISVVYTLHSKKRLLVVMRI